MRYLMAPCPREVKSGLVENCILLHCTALMLLLSRAHLDKTSLCRKKQHVPGTDSSVRKEKARDIISLLCVCR